MIIELSLIVVMSIVVFTEFLKYTNLFSLASYVNKKNIYNDRHCIKEAFYENDLYKRFVDDRYQLRY